MLRIVHLFEIPSQPIGGGPPHDLSLKPYPGGQIKLTCTHTHTHTITHNASYRNNNPSPDESKPELRCFKNKTQPKFKNEAAWSANDYNTNDSCDNDAQSTTSHT